jgi:hypothetical protein
LVHQQSIALPLKSQGGRKGACRLRVLIVANIMQSFIFSENLRLYLILQ